MKKVLLILMCCMAIQSVHAQDTPKWADKAKKAVFSIVTYDKEKTLFIEKEIKKTKLKIPVTVFISIITVQPCLITLCLKTQNVPSLSTPMAKNCR